MSTCHVPAGDDEDDLDGLDPDIFNEDEFEEFADYLRTEFFMRMWVGAVGARGKGWLGHLAPTPGAHIHTGVHVSVRLSSPADLP